MNAVTIDRRGMFMHWLLLMAALVALLASSRGIAAPASGCDSRAALAHELPFGPALENWEPLSDRAVLIWVRHDARARLVRLDRPLYGLTGAAIIDLVNARPGQSIGACGNDGIMIGGGEGDGTIARIVSIELLSPQRTAELDSGARRLASGSMRI